MESGPSHPSNVKTTCPTFDSRALCAVCGAAAIGRNFDAYTCLSCKAFFRRNAYNDHLRYTCRVQSSCEITMNTRRHCAACRLNKCFQRGMKKELIRSLTAINQASTAMIMQRQSHEPLTHRTTTMNFISTNDQFILVFDDWNILTNIRNTYENYCVEPFLASHERIPLSITTQPYRSRLKLQRLVDLKEKYFRIIVSFIKRILQSHSTIKNHYHDHIRENLPVLIILNCSELMRSKILHHLPWEHDRFLLESVLTEQLLQRLEENSYIYRTLVPYDSIIVKLFLIILAFASRICPLRTKEEYSAKHFQAFPLEILRVQNYYLTLLWKFVIYRFGYFEAIKFSVRFIQHFLRLQTIQGDMMDIIMNRDDHGQLAQLFLRVISQS